MTSRKKPRLENRSVAAVEWESSVTSNLMALRHSFVKRKKGRDEDVPGTLHNVSNAQMPKYTVKRCVVVVFNLNMYKY